MAEYCTSEDISNIRLAAIRLAGEQIDMFIARASERFETQFISSWFYPFIEDRGYYRYELDFSRDQLEITPTMRDCVATLAIAMIYKNRAEIIVFEGEDVPTKLYAEGRSFEKDYSVLFQLLMSQGVSYDLDGDGAVDIYDKKYIAGRSKGVKIVRC